MSRESRNKVNIGWRYVILLAVGVVMVYPLVWMIGASFMTNEQIFSSVSCIPRFPTLSGYKKGFEGYQGMTLLHFMVNTYKFVIPKVLFTVASATLTAYGFARFNFIGKRFSFAVLLSTLFLPQVVLNVPQYILFDQVGWLDSYLPIIIPSLMAGDTYFVYMLIQFLRGIPKELEEAAEIIYVNTVAKYPVSIFLRMSMDADVGFEWNRVLAMSLIAIVPSLIVFFTAQDSFVEGIAAGGVKG